MIRLCLDPNKSVGSQEVIREKYREAIDSETKEVSEMKAMKKMNRMRTTRIPEKSWKMMMMIAISDPP